MRKILFLLYVSPLFLFAQNNDNLLDTTYSQVKPEIVPTNEGLLNSQLAAYKKGKFYILWGWNRGFYTNSDIHFKGNDYNFTLYDVKAKDRQTPFSYKYFMPGKMTIPQTNFRFGYFLKDNFAISFGIDHMKYVMVQDQTVRAGGNISHAGYENTITNGEAVLTEDFLTFEHTDGLNYVNIEAEYFYNFLKLGFFKLNGLAGGGIGFLLPKTNAKLMDFERNDRFHLSGFGLDAKIGAEILLWDIAFVRTEGKGGFIEMPSIVTTSFSSDRASQNFWFFQWNIELGLSWRF